MPATVAPSVTPAPTTLAEPTPLADQSTATPGPSARSIFLPMAWRDADAPAKPDLIVAAVAVAPESAVAGNRRVVLSVTVRNDGNAESGGFWVELLVDPKRVPEVNDTWNALCDPPWPNAACFGGSWYVAKSLAPGESITLSSDALLTDRDYSHWTGVLGAPGNKTVYAFVDSYNPDRPGGLVSERDESNNRSAPMIVNVVSPSVDAVALEAPRDTLQHARSTPAAP